MAKDSWVLDNADGLVTTVYDGLGNDEIMQVTGQHYGHIVDRCAERRDYSSDFTPSKEGVGEHVAELPVVVVYELMRQGIWQDPQRLREWLDEPGNIFRTNKMALSAKGMARRHRLDR